VGVVAGSGSTLDFYVYIECICQEQQVVSGFHFPGGSDESARRILSNLNFVMMTIRNFLQLGSSDGKSPTVENNFLQFTSFIFFAFHFQPSTFQNYH
jgi:hypothetical protein